MTIHDLTDATPTADWTITPDEVARGTTQSGARITIAVEASGPAYDIRGPEAGANDSGGFCSIEELADLLDDVGDA